MSIKLSTITHRFESMAGTSLQERLLTMLGHIGKEHGQPTDTGLELGIELTHEELGFLMGAHRVSITRAIKSLTASGRIVRDGKHMTIVHT